MSQVADHGAAIPPALCDREPWSFIMVRAAAEKHIWR